MNYSYLVGFIVCLILITNGAFAYSYYYPIEPDNKMLIYGESSTIQCSNFLCTYNYSITNNDSVQHTINITSYLTSDIREPIEIKQINYTTKTSDTEYCSDYQQTDKDKNIWSCLKTSIAHKEWQEIESTNTLTTTKVVADLTKGITATINSAKSASKTNLLQTNQDTIKAGETKYYQITFKPTKSTGELIITAKSDSQPTIKASLDPFFSNGWYDDFEDNDWGTGGRVPTWKIISGATASTQGIVVKNGSYALKLESSTYVSTAIRATPTDYNYSTWAYIDGGNGEATMEITNDTNAAANSALMQLQKATGKIQGSTCGNGPIDMGAFSDATWYKFTIKIVGTDVNFYVQNASGAYLATASDSMALCPATQKNVVLVSSGTSSSYYDDVFFDGTTPTNYNITFNVKGKTGLTDLTNFNIDCNDNTYDGNHDSPKTISMVSGNYSCTFNRTNYDTNANYLIQADSNKSYTIYLSERLGADYNYTINYSTLYVILEDQSVSADTITDWNWLVNGTKYADTQDYNYPVEIGIDYNVCLQVGTGTADSQKCSKISVLEQTPPVTTMIYSLTQDTNNARITLTCTDNNSGCATTKYRIDGGAWQTATSGVAFDYNNVGYHYIDYNSTDNNGNIETTNRDDLNMPVYLTIKYPKNEQTLVQITENWELDITGIINISYSDLNTDKNVYLPQNTPLTIRIVDSNGNYFSRTYVKDYNGYVSTETLQPYLVDTTTGLLTTITTKDAYANTSLPEVTIKIYKDVAILGRTLVEELLTDSKGQALSLLVVGDKYEFETYYNGVFIKTFDITASSSTIYIYLTLPGTTPDINSTSFNVSFTPLNTALTKLTVGNATFTQTIYNFGGTTATCVSRITQNGTVLSTQTASCSDANTVFTRTVAWTDINAGTVVSTITVSGTGITFTKNYTVSSSFGATYNIFTGLTTGMRTDMGCSTDTSTTCMPLLVIAIILSIALVLGGISMLGAFNTQASGLIFLIAIVFFTFVGWIPIILPAALVLIVLAFIVNERRG